MNDINVVSITGRLTRDMEVKYSRSGAPVGRLSIAVNGSRKRGDQWEQTASFIDCILLGKSATNLEQYLVKGRQVAVSGELRQDRWDQDGQTKTRITVVVGSIALLGGSQSGGSNEGGGGNGQRDRSSQMSPRQDTGKRDSLRQDKGHSQARQESFDDRGFKGDQRGRQGFDPPPGRNSGYQGHIAADQQRVVRDRNVQLFRL